MLPKPGEIVKSKSSDPQKMFLFAHPKTGKTSNCCLLPNHLLIDIEGGSNFIDATKINVKEYAIENGISPLDALKEISNTIRDYNAKEKRKVYDYLIIDSSTSLESMAKDLAALLYKSSPMGKNWKGGDIYNLPNGAGYGWVRQAFEMIYNDFDNLCNKCLIIIGHTKTASINKDGKDLQARDISLTGKLKTMVCADADAIGYLYRDKGNPVNILSFKTNELDLVTGARPAHLRNQEFKISELNPETGEISSFWDEVFLDLKK